MNRKPLETKRESNRETKTEGYMCDVMNVDSFLKKPYINPKVATPTSTVQCSTVQFAKE